LDIAQQANQSLERWQACLDRLDEVEAIDRQRGETDHAIAIPRFNRYSPLIRLGRLDAAQQVLEASLAVFQGVGDATMQSKGDHRPRQPVGRTG
jgi:hypothetical protein